MRSLLAVFVWFFSDVHPKISVFFVLLSFLATRSVSQDLQSTPDYGDSAHHSSHVPEQDVSLITLEASNVNDSSPDSLSVQAVTSPPNLTSYDSLPSYIELCPSGVACNKLGGDCISCDINASCHYGRNVSVVCSAKPLVVCSGARNFTRWVTCRYCYQTPTTMHYCTKSTGCRVASAPRASYEANCTVKSNVLCLGRRRFYKMLPCNWTSGKRWSTALILSITMGGFGADRFYLGLWREGIGKLFSFGGLGVWTLVDVILVATGYIGPADGSLFI